MSAFTPPVFNLAQLDDVELPLLDGGYLRWNDLLGKFEATELLLTDRTTGEPYRLYVDNGALSVEAVNFNPTMLPGLELWLEPETSESIAGASVGTLPDLSGNSRVVTFAPAVPLVAGPNGKKAIRTTNHSMSVAMPCDSRSGTLVFVLKLERQSGAGNAGFLGAFAGAKPNETIGTPQILSTAGQSVPPGGGVAPLPVQEWAVVMFALGATSTRIRVDGRDFTSATLVTADTGESVTLFNFDGGGYPTRCDCAAVMLFSESLSEAECASLESYVYNRFAIPVQEPDLIADSDSIGYGYPALLPWPVRASQSLGLTLRNFSVSGASLFNLIDREDLVNAMLGPGKTFMICAGVNDADFAPGIYGRIVARCQSAKDTGARVLLVAMLPRTDAVGSGTPAAEVAANTALLKLDFPTAVAANIYSPGPGISFADLLIVPGQAAGANNPSDAAQYPDGLHPSESVHVIIAELVVTAYGLL